MVSRYFGVVFVLVSVAISVNAEDSSNTSLITTSPTISMNSSAIVNMTTALTPVITSTPIVPTTSSAKSNSSTPPAPTSTSPVIPSPSSTATPPPTKAPTKTPHGTPTKGRSFDAASFFGGIILGVIVMIASFLGYTWWQNKRKSYHSL